MTDHDETDPNPEAEHPMASGAFERIQDYLDSGRDLASLSIEDLEGRFVAAFKARVANVAQASDANDDAEAEYILRSIEPPYHLVKAEIEEMTRQISEAFSKLSNEQIAELDGDMVAKLSTAAIH